MDFIYQFDFNLSCFGCCCNNNNKDDDDSAIRECAGGGGEARLVLVELMVMENILGTSCQFTLIRLEQVEAFN